MKNNFGEKISLYKNTFSDLSDLTTIQSELNRIEDGTYRNAILKCRKLYSAGDKVAYKNEKANLPCVTFSGSFNGAHKKSNLSSYTNFIILDIDNIEGEIESIKKQIYKDQYISAIWASPSGNGLKILVRTDASPEMHKEYFDSLLIYFKVNHNIEIDKSGSDICRLCYSSFDDKLLIRNDSIIFTYTPLPLVVGKDISRNNTLKISSNSISIDRAQDIKNKNLQRNRETIKKIIIYLTKNKLSITSTYSDWIKVAYAIANSFTHDLGEKYFLQLCRLDGALHDEYKSIYLLDYCYRNRRVGAVDFASIVFLAKESGFIVK